MNYKMKDSERERFQLLLTAVLDGEATEQEKAEFQRFLEQYPECRHEWDQTRNLKEVLQTMTFRKLPDEAWDEYWTRVYNRLERGISWILITLGAAVLATYGLFQAVESILGDARTVWVVKVGLLALIAGAVLLVLSVFREKWFTARVDKYRKEVRR